MKAERPAMLNAPKESGGSAVFFFVLLAFALILLADAWFYSQFIVIGVQGPSMNDTFFGGVETTLGEYEGGDIVYADRYARAERGDVIIIDVEKYESQGLFKKGTGRIIKRLIAVSGDEVRCEDGILYLKKAGETDFSPVEEDYVHYPTERFGPYLVGEGEIFFLGDHRTDSKDSRTVGCLKEEDIFAVVPDWAIAVKDAITAWEGFRGSVHDFFSF